MPRPTPQQITYMAVCVITEMDEVARRATAAGRQAVEVRDRLGAIVRDGGQLTEDELAPFVRRAERITTEVREVEENVQNLTHSEYALNLARTSLS